jgi:Arc/MetJ-type ribon-helix-helix transcriptional regulator
VKNRCTRGSAIFLFAPLDLIRKVQYSFDMDALPPELLEELEHRCEDGSYATVADLIRHALRALDESAATECWLEEQLAEAEASGPATPMTADDWSDIEREGEARIRAKNAE